MSGYLEIDDKSDETLTEIETAIDSGLQRVGLYAESEIVKSMKPNPAVESGEGGWKKSFGFRAVSPPGSPPYQQTGNLARAIISGKVGRLKYAVGTRRGYSVAPYGYFTEQGTRNMAPRPWLSRVFKNTGKINRVFFAGVERALKGGDS